MHATMATDKNRDNELILVDGLDRQVGTATKWQAHTDGLLHRAFSVVLVREGERGLELLLSQRALGKYHSGGLWANSCCSHPRAGERTIDAAYRRVREELGCEATGLREVASFAYRAEFANGLSEHEYDHVLVGDFAGTLAPDPQEVSDTRWVGVDELALALAREPRQFCVWAPMVLSLALQHLD
ncbi:MAG: isopentenyl-diphosphate Delta-isomerase [Coriobacteriales bacterium]|nr:isopentenyl-diphosphate Delta-isomerase [Coriobacteriales bacterium]